jgi:hypothetical protein
MYYIRLLSKPAITLRRGCLTYPDDEIGGQRWKEHPATQGFARADARMYPTEISKEGTLFVCYTNCRPSRVGISTGILVIFIRHRHRDQSISTAATSWAVTALAPLTSRIRH